MMVFTFMVSTYKKFIPNNIHLAWNVGFISQPLLEYLGYCKRGYFPWGEISRKCWQDISHGGNFHDTTPISFIKVYGFYFRVGVIFAKKTTAKNAKITPTQKISTFTVVVVDTLWADNMAQSCNKVLETPCRDMMCDIYLPAVVRIFGVVDHTTQSCNKVLETPCGQITVAHHSIQ